MCDRKMRNLPYLCADARLIKRPNKFENAQARQHHSSPHPETSIFARIREN